VATEPLFDPLDGPKTVIDGRIVPMVRPGDDIASGRIYIDGGRIVAVQPSRQKPPLGFSKIKPLKTGGTIFPGLIELHNHLSYNVLPLWNVPKQYSNRGQWGSHRDYRRLISGPMNVLGRTDGLIQAVVRWVETKSLVAGVTTSQGVALYSNSGAIRFYRGLIRNVEQTNDDELPEASPRIGDIAATKSKDFLAELERWQEKGRKKILHLAEGVDERANDHFRALKIGGRTWAINNALIGIHATGLKGRNFATMRSRGGSIVWSPLSNLLLYGGTTDVGRAIAEGMPVSLGSDWSPSGSKNMLMEMKVAKAWSDLHGIGLSDFDVVSMATRVPAEMMGWGGQLGTIEAGKRADFVVIDDKGPQPCRRLVDARESSVVLVVVNGVRRYGQPRLMRNTGVLETRRVAGVSRAFHLSQNDIDPVVGGLSIADAEERLTEVLSDLARYALDLERGNSATLDLGSGQVELQLGTGAILGDEPGRWFLELEQDHDGPDMQRHQLVVDGHRTGVFDPMSGAARPLSELFADADPINLDPLSAIDDRTFWSSMASQRNVPREIKAALFKGYRQRQPTFTEGAVSDATDGAVEDSYGGLSIDDRRLIVEQASLLLEQAYAHLPFKRSLHAVDPIQRLRLLDYRISQESVGDQSEVDFHREMIDVFTSLRDLHTTYVVPYRYRAAVLMLPFRLEQCFEPGADGQLRELFVASKVDPGFDGPRAFVEGVEITHWNGVPIRRAIEVLGEKQAAGNLPAAFARALDAMALRPMLSSVHPDEAWVEVTYVDSRSSRERSSNHTSGSPRSRSHRFEWQQRDAPPELRGEHITTAMGIDAQTHAVGAVRKDLYAGGHWSKAAEKRGALDTPMALAEGRDLGTYMPWFFRAHHTPDNKFGYIRIFSFATRDPRAFVAEFARLVNELPADGLIIDVRGNAGGSIEAAESLLQVLTETPVRTQRAQFTTSPLLHDICARHAPSKQFVNLDLSPWTSSLAQAVQTGSSYSQGFPITTDAALAAVDPSNRYGGPVVLIVDALCYSATDMFAAGFADHEVGVIVGAADNTGAGGANVWRHSDLLRLAAKDSGLRELPGSIDMRVAVRRTTRVRSHEGEILEDLGIDIDVRHYMTRDDIFKGNQDLIKTASDQLLG